MFYTHLCGWVVALKMADAPAANCKSAAGLLWGEATVCKSYRWAGSDADTRVLVLAPKKGTTVLSQ